jgi:pyrimidine-nucleoside phosphorylase
MPSLNPAELIVKKRDGGRHSAAELEALIQAVVSGEIADYQLSAWLMACYFRGLDQDETVALTRAMLASGKAVNLGRLRRAKIDKHSTGGVGDKVSLCLAPLVAACGVVVPMIAGRGLGHTGGTLDKLEAIPGFRVDLKMRAFERILGRLGTAIVGQTDELAPADRKLYALRDVTGTVESIPLIVASILSKKLAAGLDGLVLDVKVGRGAFMKDLQAARVLGRALVRVGRKNGLRVVALLSDMNAPLGRTVGNALEVREAIEVLQGGGPADTRELTLALGTEMLLLAQRTNAGSARRELEQALASGRALDLLRRMITAQGGDARVVDDPARLPRARFQVRVSAPHDGVVGNIDARELGSCAIGLGAGRLRADQRVDPAAGIELLARPGERVQRGQPLAILHAARRSQTVPLLARVAAAFELRKRPSPARPLILGRIRS